MVESVPPPTKLRTVVPDFRATIPFEQGAREIVEWHDADASRQQVSARLDAVMDALALEVGERLGEQR